MLRQDGSRLVQVGAVTGLGEEGERIYGVRFMGERGYIVTFRQTDPLYTLDLSNPTAPRVAGQLKIPGYSAYLHPVGENQLLGVGREGTAVKTSLFDVSNLAAPTEVTKLLIPSSTTSVEKSRTRSCTGRRRTSWSCRCRATTAGLRRRGGRAGGAERADRGRADRRTTARRATTTPRSQRSLVIGDKLYTLSWLGLSSSNLDNLGQLGFTSFAVTR